jgi:MoaA/NifB/PqqE/SkfB family radical SAM enzyme
MARRLRVVADDAGGHGPGTLLCRAPWSSLHLDQMGDARPCCQSTFVLGNVGSEGVQEIWAGERAERLRAAVADGDLSLGCGYCEWSGGQGGHDATYARRYDELPLRTTEQGPARIEIAPSNTCNLQCTMCNGEWSSSIRSQREKLPPLPKAYGDDFFIAVEEWVDGIDEVELFGGEPLLARESLRLLELLVGHRVDARITTNGTIWNAKVERLVDELALNVVVSIDGASPETYEAIRVGASWDDVQANLRRFRAACDRHGKRLDLAHCLMVENWWELPELLTMAAELRAPVFVNTVLSPVSSSLHHLSPPELTHVVQVLESRQSEVARLGEPWIGTYRTELDRLRSSLADASRGRRHQHLGGGGDGADAQDLPSPPDPPAPGRTVVVHADERLLVRRVDVQGEGDGLPPVVADDLVGRPSGAAMLADPSTFEVLRRLLVWSGPRTRTERVVGSEGRLVCETRTVEADGSGLRIEVEQRLLPSDADRAAELAAAGGPVVELEIDAQHVVVGVGPDASALAALGLVVAVGDRCEQPADVLGPALLDPPPDAVLFRTDPLTTVGELRWPDGRVLALSAREHFQDGRPAGSLVYLGSPTSVASGRR